MDILITGCDNIEKSILKKITDNQDNINFVYDCNSDENIVQENTINSTQLMLSKAISSWDKYNNEYDYVLVYNQFAMVCGATSEYFLSNERLLELNKNKSYGKKLTGDIFGNDSFLYDDETNIIVCFKAYLVGDNVLEYFFDCVPISFDANLFGKETKILQRTTIKRIDDLTTDKQKIKEIQNIREKMVKSFAYKIKE